MKVKFEIQWASLELLLLSTKKTAQMTEFANLQYCQVGMIFWLVVQKLKGREDIFLENNKPIY